MSKPSDELWAHDVEIWKSGAQVGLLDGTTLAGNYFACQSFLKDLERLLGFVKSYWSSRQSSMYHDDREALKEFNIPIQDFVKFSTAQQQSIVRRYRQNERLRLSVKYGPIDLLHQSGPFTLWTRKGHNKKYWVTTYCNSSDMPAPQYRVPLRLWGYGDSEEEAVKTHQECLAWLDEKAENKP